MLRTTILLTLIVTVATVVPASDDVSATDSRIRAVVLDYIEGYYLGDAKRMESALHPRLAKRHLRHHPVWGRPEMKEMSAMELVAGVAAGWGTRTAPEDRRADIEILDVDGDMASVKLEAHAFTDYLHLQRSDDRWQIVNVLWARRSPEPSAAILAALEHPDRPDAERELDALRRPAEVLAFAGIEPGMKVAELMAGTGWYTEILSRALGPGGTLYMQNNAFVLERFAEQGVQERLAGSRLGNVVRHDAELDDLGFAPASLDVALMILFYHDTYWQGTDRAAMNRAILEALKPGGVFLVVDHFASAGTSDRDVSTLHRGDADLIRSEILAAGFLFDGSSPVLRHPEDDRTLNVFDPGIRRRTDRFVYRFVKPGRSED